MKKKYQKKGFQPNTQGRPGAAAWLRAFLWWGSENLGNKGLKSSPKPEIQFVHGANKSFPDSRWFVSKEQVFCMVDVPDKPAVQFISMAKMKDCIN